MYNNRLKIQFKFSPYMQIVYNFFGYLLVLEAYTELSDNKLYDEKYFIYTGRNWNKLVDHIKNQLYNN